MARQGFIGLGTNVGDRVSNLSQAIELLAGMAGVNVTGKSRIYLSVPVDVSVAQDDYLNQVVGIDTSLSPMELRRACVTIETELGREVEHGLGLPRTMDLDIISLGDLVGKFGQVILPHPRYSGRRFVLEPLADIAPTYCDPQTGLSVSFLLKNCNTEDLQVHTTEAVEV